MRLLFVPLPYVDPLCVLVRDRIFQHPCGNAAFLGGIVIDPADPATFVSVSSLILTHFCSMSGLAQFVAARGLGTLQEWCEEGYKAVARVDKDISGEIRRMMHRPVK